MKNPSLIFPPVIPELRTHLELSVVLFETPSIPLQAQGSPSHPRPPGLAQPSGPFSFSFLALGEIRAVISKRSL